jgi:hypothetical protein
VLSLQEASCISGEPFAFEDTGEVLLQLMPMLPPHPLSLPLLLLQLLLWHCWC